MPYLPVSTLHKLYYETIGDPSYQPVLFIHGGPGYGCRENDRDWFNHRRLYGVLVDQRGAGQSRPLGELRENTIDHLVADFEQLRQHLHIRKWHLFGGSWGTTLALYYAECHPDSVLSLTLRSVCLMDQRSVDWYMYDMGNFFPEAFLQFTEDVPPKVIEENRLLEFYLKQVSDSTRAPSDLTWETRWFQYEDVTVDQHNRRNSQDKGNPGKQTFDLDEHAPTHSPGEIRALARIECTYFQNCRVPLVERAHLIRTLPVFIVHGRYDVLSPVANAYLLKQQLANYCRLEISEGEGHSARDPNTKRQLEAALDRIAETGSPV